MALTVRLNEPDQTRLSGLLHEELRSKRLMGIGAAMAVDGVVVATAAAGLTRRSGRELTSAETWHVGSVTKPMTATLLGLLSQDGEVSLDQPISELLPALTAPMHHSWKPVTLRHLLTHTHGGPANLPLTTQLLHPESRDELVAERTRILGSILAKPLRGQPGSQFRYSNFGYTLAGHIAEQRTNTAYEDLVSERVFQPLGMESVGFGAPGPDAPVGHLRKFGKTIAVRPGPRADNGPAMSAAGRAHMTLTDLAAFGNDHLHAVTGQPGGLLHPETAAEMSRLRIPGINSGSYACGWVVEDRAPEDKVMWHNGSNTMWVAVLSILPSRRTVLAFATNEGAIRRSESAFAAISQKMIAALD